MPSPKSTRSVAASRVPPALAVPSRGAVPLAVSSLGADLHAAWPGKVGLDPVLSRGFPPSPSSRAKSPPAADPLLRQACISRRPPRGCPAIVAAAAMAGPSKDGLVVGSAAERGRCRRRRASPPPTLVCVGLPPRGGRPISPGSASGMSGDRGSGGDGRAERGWTARCHCRGTRAPPRPAGTVPRPEGRAEGIPRPVVSAAVGDSRESSVMPP